jgi:hypothetical protein
VDNDRFDGIAKAVAGAASRRSMLRGAAVGATGAILALIGVARSDDWAAEAQPTGRGGGRKGGQGKGGGGRNGGKGNGGKKHQCFTIHDCPNSDNPCKKFVCQGGKCRKENRKNGLDCGGGPNRVCQNGTCVCQSGSKRCSGTCVVTDTDANNCGECERACPSGQVCSNGLACQAASCLPVTGFEDDVTLAANGGLTATTTGSANQAAIILADIPAGTTFGDLASMKSDFDFSLGKCGAGQPRFVVRLQNGRCPYAAFPPALCNTEGAQGSTGELINNEEPFVWNDNLCGGSGNLTNLYSEVFALYENEPVAKIELVVDTSSGENTVTLSPCVTVA